MSVFLFWNLNGKPLADRVAQAVLNFDVDLFLLAESEITPAVLATAFNSVGRADYQFASSNDSKVQIYVRLRSTSVEHAFDSTRMTIRRLQFPGSESILLAAVHLQSKGPWDRDDQTLASTEVAETVALIEDREGHQRTILVGDLNMNPFDPGVMGAHALHAVMTRTLARAEGRIVSGKSYRMFYNPMWGHFGDRTPGPAGTFYLNSSKPSNSFWNMYDQVLVRPALQDKLREVRILDTDGKDSLLTEHGLPQTSKGSDHLPILFTIDL